VSCQEKTQPRSSPGQYHPYSKACWRQHQLWRCFSAAGTGSLIRIEGKMNVLDENILWTSDWGNDPQHTAKITQETQGQLCECP